MQFQSLRQVIAKSFKKIEANKILSDIFTKIYKLNKCQQVEIQARLVQSAGYNLTPLHCSATQSFLPSPLKPQLYHIPINSTHKPL